MKKHIFIFENDIMTDLQKLILYRLFNSRYIFLSRKAQILRQHTDGMIAFRTCTQVKQFEGSGILLK